MGAGLTDDLARMPPVRPVAPRALATLIQAVLHGLAVQHAADPKSFRTEELMKLFLDMLGIYLWGDAAKNGKKHVPKTNKSKKGSGARKPESG